MQQEHDELARVTGGLMTEATTPATVTGVATYTKPSTIRRAKALLAQMTPYPAWIRSHPRSPEAIDGRQRLIRELGATIAGFRPDVIRVIAPNGLAAGAPQSPVSPS